MLESGQQTMSRDVFLSRKTAPGISKNELTSELNKLSISSIQRLDLLQPSDEIIQEVANLITF